MDDAPKVQLFLQDRLLAEVPFTGDAVRIGRMRENDLVVNNLAVSRFHAVLRRAARGFEVEDLGSENGTFVAGRRVRGTSPFGWDEPITLGEHTIVVRSADAAGVAPGDEEGWALAQEDPAHGNGLEAPFAADEVDGAVAEAHLLTDPEPGVEDMPDPDGDFSFDESELDDGALEPDDEALLAPPVTGELGALDDPFTDPLGVSVAPPGEHTALFDFGMSGDLASSGGAHPAPAEPGETVLEAPALAVEDEGQGEGDEAVEASPSAAPEPAQPAAEPELHAGIIVQRRGKLERVVPWDADEIVAGRGSECTVVLPEPGVSRRHVAFVRSGERHLVRDLGSVNKVYLNGEVVHEAELSVGDVVRVEEFELTFVLDRQPVGEGIRMAATLAVGDGSRTQLRGALLPEESGPTRIDLVDTEEAVDADEDKPLERAEVVAEGPAAASLEEAATPLRLELELPAERLPAALRDALRALAEGELVVPAELRIRVR